MAFVVEDGTGLEDATAYIDEAFLDAYWADVGVTFTQPSAEKQSAIIRATRHIEHVFGCQFKGRIIRVEQALSWPRAYVYDCEGRAVPCDAVPKQVQQATAEYARRVLDTPAQALYPDPSRDPSITKLREKVGPIEEETEFIPGGTGVLVSYPTADDKLIDLLCAGGQLSAVR